MAGRSRGADRYRRVLSFALRFGLAAAVVLWLVREAGWEEVSATLRGADPRFLLVAVGALTLESLAKLWNWGRLLDHLGCSATARPLRLIQAYLVGALAGTVLPSTASTDAMRGLLAQRLFGGRPTAHAAAIIINNLLVWTAACCLGLLCTGVLAAAGELPSYELFAVPFLAGVVLTAIGLHVALKYYRWLWLAALRRVMRGRWYALRRAMRRLAKSLLIFERRNVPFAPRLIVAVLAAMSSALTFAATAWAVGVDLSLVAWGLIVPVITLSGLLPISISGLGGAQAVHVVLLAPFGVDVAHAFATSALYAVLNIMFTVVTGSLTWLFGPDVLKSASEAA